MAEQKPGNHSVKILARDLPMPRYGYQTPFTGNFAFRYDEKKEQARASNREAALLKPGTRALPSLAPNPTPRPQPDRNTPAG